MAESTLSTIHQEKQMHRCGLRCLQERLLGTQKDQTEVLTWAFSNIAPGHSIQQWRKLRVALQAKQVD